MNILWIEDFGGGLGRSEAIIQELFGDLIIERSIIDDNWDDDDWHDDKPLPNFKEYINSFFEKHSSFHNIFLCHNWLDFKNFFEKREYFTHEIDLVIIDINLTKQLSEDDTNPPEYKDDNEFNTKAGFYIYNFLLTEGFPVQNMCLLTGEEDTSAQFKEDCKKLLMQEPKTFEKNNGFTNIRDWINDHKNSTILQLKRGILDGIDYCSRILNSDDNVRFKDFINPGKPNSDANENYENEKQDSISREYILHYFELMKILSQTLNSNKIQNSKQTVKNLIRTIVHEWDNNTHSFHNILNERVKRRQGNPYVEVLTQFRNSTSHSAKLEPFNEKDCAILFLISMRHMVKFESNDEADFEKKLFELLCPKLKEQDTTIKDEFEKDRHKVNKLKEQNEMELDCFYNKQKGKVNSLLKQLLNNNIDSEVMKERLYKIPWHHYEPNVGYTIKKIETERNEHFEKRLFFVMAALFDKS